MEKQNMRIYSHLVCAVGIIVATVLLSAEPVFGQLIVRPMRIELTTRPGETAKGLDKTGHKQNRGRTAEDCPCRIHFKSAARHMWLLHCGDYCHGESGRYES